MGKTTENPGESFVTQFHVWMEAAGYPHETALANMAGVDPATLERILKGERGMGPDVAKRLAKALRVKQVDFFRAYGLLDPEPGQAMHDAKKAAIERIMANLEQLRDDDLARIELLIRSYAGSVDATLPAITAGGEINLGGTLTTKHIKGKGRAA